MRVWPCLYFEKENWLKRTIYIGFYVKKRTFEHESGLRSRNREALEKAWSSRRLSTSMSAWATAGSSSRIRWKAELTGGDVKCEQASSHLGSDVRPRPTLWRVQPTQGGRRLQVQPSPIQPILSATCNDSRTKAGPKSILKKPLYWGGQTWPQKLLSCA